MFDKILVANRGEIAVRIIRTCKRLGIGTIAVYSDADSRSLHVQMADEALHIGGPHARESYLNTEKIISAALSTGCQAVHPGYGFLSESHQFVETVEAAGLTFIGPPANAVALLGDKITSKKLALKAGVPVITGHADVLNGVDDALTVADGIGYPVLLKPAAGGGGKGMRIVFNPDEMQAALEAARQETRKAFGDSRIFMERYIERPRHVEIQILSDSHGNRRRLKLNVNGRVCRFRLRVEQFFIFVAFSGITRVFEVYTPREWNLMKHMPAKIKRAVDDVLVCPMPGMVVDVQAKKGERVFRGQTLVILESMKMESNVASPVDGIVAEVRVAAGQAVESGELLIKFIT